MWKRKLEAEAPEAAIFYRSGSGKHEMNGSGTGSGSERSQKILEAEAEAIKNSPLPHHWFLRDSIISIVFAIIHHVGPSVSL